MDNMVAGVDSEVSPSDECYVPVGDVRVVNKMVCSARFAWLKAR